MGQVDAVDWGYVTLRTDNTRWSSRIRIDLPRLDSLNKMAFAPILTRVTDPSGLRDALVDCHAADLQANDPLDNPTDQLAVVPESESED